MRGTQEERSPLNGACAGIGTLSVRSVAAGGPERVESAVPLPLLLSSYAAAVLRRPVRYPRPNRVVGMTKQVNRFAGDAEGVRDAGETVLSLADTSCQWDCRGFGVCRGKGFQVAVGNPVATSLQKMMGLGVGVPPWKGIPGRRCYSVCHLLVSVLWVGVPRLGLGGGVKRTVHFRVLGVPASGETFNHAGPSATPSLATVRGARLNSRRPVHHGRTFGELCSILCARSRVQGRDPPGF